MKIRSLETIILIIGAIAILLIISEYDINGTLKAIASLNVADLSAALLMLFLFTFAKILPWSYILRKIKLKMPLSQSIAMMYAFFGLGIIPTSIGQFLPLRYLDRYQKDARFFSLGIILALNATAALALALLGLLAAIQLSQYVAYLLALFAVYYIILSLLGFRPINRRLPGVIKRLLKPKKHPVFRSVVRYVNDIQKHNTFLSQQDILSEMVLFIPSLLAEAAMLFFIFSALGQNISIISAIFIFAVSVTIGNLSFLPSGIGATDTALVALAILFGAPGAIAILAAIVFRFLNTLIVVLLGYGSFVYVKSIHVPTVVEETLKNRTRMLGKKKAVRK